jgi:CheY-like chemotaxis protein
VIDDAAGVRAVVCDLLTGFGYDADAAEDGPRGLALFERYPYDLVITDLKMPGLTGWHVVEAVRSRRPMMPMLMISGFATEADVERARQERVEFLHKPFRSDELRQAIGEALARGLPSPPPTTLKKPLAKAPEGWDVEPGAEEGRGST